jgi:hypothetical protein
MIMTGYLFQVSSFRFHVTRFRGLAFLPFAFCLLRFDYAQRFNLDPSTTLRGIIKLT